VRLKYLHAFRDRTGTLRFYFRRNGIRTRLPRSFGSRDFLDAYAAALGEQTAEPAERKGILPAHSARWQPATLHRRIFCPCRQQVRTNYRRAIDRFLIEHGHRRVDQMKREHVDAILGKFADKPGAGIILLKRMRTLLRYAIEIGWRDSDPTAGVASLLIPFRPKAALASSRESSPTSSPRRLGNKSSLTSAPERERDDCCQANRQKHARRIHDHVGIHRDARHCPKSLFQCRLRSAQGFRASRQGWGGVQALRWFSALKKAPSVGTVL
jgi:hypothetical protein